MTANLPFLSPLILDNIQIIFYHLIYTLVRSITLRESCERGTVEKSLILVRVWRKTSDDISNVGDYSCVATNKYGSIKSKIAQLYVKCEFLGFISLRPTIKFKLYSFYM